MKFLLINQTFYPDVASTAQHLTDFAHELVKNGNKVTVLTSEKSYDIKDVKYLRRETYQGIEIKRVKTTSFGKTAKWRRAIDFASFIFSCVWQLILSERVDSVVALTSPPLISFIAAIYAKITKAKFVYWVMDLNPDEALAANWLKENSYLYRFLEAMSVFSLNTANKIIVLDRFMKQRIIAKGVSSEKISVLPPWPHENEVFFNEEGRSIFRQGLNIEDKYVVMYSGNHSPCHPLSTLLETAKLLSDREEFVFLFVGGGSEYPKVKAYADQHKLQNVITLPYQPLHLLSSSLSAADLQVVVMGNEFVGTIHPCKIYNILMIGCPVLYIGPEESHIADILDTLDEEYSFISIRHGAAYKLKEMLEENLQKRGNKARYSDFKMTEDYKQLLVEEVLS